MQHPSPERMGDIAAEDRYNDGWRLWEIVGDGDGDGREGKGESL